MNQNSTAKQQDVPKKPNPGTSEALELGCRCPILDNGRGRGYMGQPGVFVYSVDCPVHTHHEKSVA